MKLKFSILNLIFAVLVPLLTFSQTVNTDLIPDKSELSNYGLSSDEIDQIEEIKEQLDNSNNQQNNNKVASEVPTKNVEEKDINKEDIANKQETKEEIENEIKNEKIRLKKDNFMIFGQDYFLRKNIKFYQKASEINTPNNYILGTGDEINISIWGQIDYNVNHSVSQEGYIYIKQAGRIYLRGLTMQNAKSLIKSKFSNNFDLSNSQLELTLSKPRTISVNIVGEVKNPGTYVIPALNSAFNTLIMSGGLNKNGSVRNIYIKRNGKFYKKLDVYDFLMNPNYKQDFFMQNGDYIFIPTSKKVVRIGGEVNNSSYYELKEGENFNSLLKFAGGFTPLAYTRKLQIKRIINNEEILLDIDLNENNPANTEIQIENGDQIIIKKIPRGISNTVSVIGAVKLPGLFEYNEGIKVFDLIQKAEGISSDAYLTEGLLTRINKDLTTEFIKIDLKKILLSPASPDNILLKTGDILQVYSKKYFKDYHQVHIEGQVRNAGSYSYGKLLTLKKLVTMAGGFTEKAMLDYVYIRRLSPELKYTYSSIIIDTTNNFKSLNNIELKKGDKITVLSKNKFNHENIISVIGEVRNPGNIQYGDGITLKDALMLSGGVTKKADLKNVKVIRLVESNTNNNDERIIKAESISYDLSDLLDKNSKGKQIILQPNDVIKVRKSVNYQKTEFVKVYGEVEYPGIYPILYDNEQVSDIILRAGGLNNKAHLEGAYLYRQWHNLGKVFLDLKKVMKSPNKSNMNYSLLPNDSIFVPRTNELVTVNGAIQYKDNKTNRINTPLNKSRRAKFYINQYCGGFTKNALKKKTYVKEVSGRIKKTHNYGLFKIYPKPTKGSNIFAVYKPIKEKTEKNRQSESFGKTVERVTAPFVAIFTTLILAKSL